MILVQFKLHIGCDKKDKTYPDHQHIAV